MFMESNRMYTNIKTNTSPFKLFQQIGRSIRKTMDPAQMLQGAVEAIGWHLGLDRCLALLVDDQNHDIGVAAEFAREPYKAIGSKRYQLRSTSEWYRLLSEGKPIPLTHIQIDSTNQTSLLPELDQIVRDTASKTAVAFPLIHQGALLGSLTVHYCEEDRTISEDILEIGEAFAEELASSIRQAKHFQENLTDGRVFSSTMLPLIVLESGSFKIVQTNDAAVELLDGGNNDLSGLPFLELFAESDAQRIREAAGKLSTRTPVVNISGLLAPSSGGQPVMLDAAVSTVSGESNEIVLALFPNSGSANNKAPAAYAATPTSTTEPSKVEELVGSLSKQLNWERAARTIISKLHSTLDRDTVLQTTADSVGRALRASACLIVRTDTPTASMVTHEYADPNLSPLGLGRSGQLPVNTISHCKQRTVSIADLSSTTRPPGLPKEDVNALLDNGVGALLGTPISYHGIVYGVVVVESDEAREWTPQEVEMLETVAGQAALALINAQAYAQVKDQLFNMNLISNLTQQLTTALDQAGRNTRSDKPPEIPAESPSTPLSTRELEVLKLIASGLANREIAQKLFLTESTVELHASRIRKKLKLKSRTALVKFACDNHLV
jgi:GAF domain-containing protein